MTFVTAKTHSPLEKITSQLFESIQLTWPLLVISLVICVVAGIIVWFLVSRKSFLTFLGLGRGAFLAPSVVSGA